MLVIATIFQCYAVELPSQGRQAVVELQKNEAKTKKPLRLKVLRGIDYNGGESGIRTRGTFNSSHDFQSCAFNQLSHLSI